MKFKFAKVKYNYLKGQISWQLLIENIQDLMHYFEIVQPRQVERYFDVKKRLNKKFPPEKFKDVALHLNEQDYGLYASIACKPNRKSIIDDLFILSDTFCKPKINAVLKGNKLIINAANGWCCLLAGKSGHEILEIIEKDKLVFPYYSEQDIHVSKWLGGKHYYARIGNTSVIVNGKTKWNTAKEAERNAKEFLKTIKE